MWHHDITIARRCQFSAVCLTVFPLEFRPRTFTIGFYGKNSIISELMILECSFPLKSETLQSQKRTRTVFLFETIVRLTYPQKCIMFTVKKNKRRTCETIPLARTNGEDMGGARAMKAPLHDT